MNVPVLTLLLVGHLLGDFYFQSEENELPAKLIKHGFLYFGALVIAILPIIESSLLKYVFFISLSHLVLDWMTARFVNTAAGRRDKRTDLKAFLIDQLIHLGIIFIAAVLISNLAGPFWPHRFFYRLPPEFYAWVLALLAIARPASITIKKVLHIYAPAEGEEGHANAGALIGVLERLIVLLFLSKGQYSAVGFILTAKSIARYDKIAKDPFFSEYYLLGTLLSLAAAVIIYLVCL